MRKLHFLLTSLVLLALALTFTSCDKDDDDDVPLSKQELLVDKWWYDVAGQNRGDHKFNSAAKTVDFTYPSPIQGTYLWGPNDSMYITMPGGAPPFTLWFKTVTETNMEYWPTFEPVENIYKFTTTKQ
jgi:hypothetical protein